MTHLYAFLLVVATSNPLLRPQAASSEEWLVKGNEVGQFYVGMSVDRAKNLLGVERADVVDLNLEGFFSPAMVILSAQGRRSLVAELELSDTHQWIFYRIQVYDPRYRTSRGVHVGSSYAQLEKEYPGLRLSDEGGTRTLVDTKQGLSYIIGNGPLVSAIVTELLLTGANR